MITTRSVRFAHPLAAVLAATCIWAAAFIPAATARTSAPSLARSGAVAPKIRPGRYVLHGTARADATLLPSRDVAVDVLALVAPGDRERTVRLHLRSRGYACDLLARADAAGHLALAPAQSCRVEVDDAEWRGSIEARVREGAGRLSDGALSLAIAWDLSGSLAPAADRAKVPGTTLEIPLSGASLPVHGTLQSSAAGAREEAAPAR